MNDECRVTVVPKSELEQMLSAKYGSALLPVNPNAKRPTGIIDLSGLMGRPKLTPKHLTADRLRKLVADGKTRDDVLKMYNFANKNTFGRRILELGCLELLPSKKGGW